MFDSNGQTYLIGLAKAIDPPHLALLVGVGQHTHGRLLACDAEYEVFPALLCYVLPQLAQQPRRPLLLHLNFLVLKQRFHLLSSLPSTIRPDSAIRGRSTQNSLYSNLYRKRTVVKLCAAPQRLTSAPYVAVGLRLQLQRKDIRANTTDFAR